jgi:hypothetical protein
MGSSPLDTFLLRRISEADQRRPGPRPRPELTPRPDLPAAAPGNPLPATIKLR